jgi:hypothetical protein
VTGGLDEKSGRTGDCHVPFRGSLGVKLPGATRLVKEIALHSELDFR